MLVCAAAPSFVMFLPMCPCGSVGVQMDFLFSTPPTFGCKDDLSVWDGGGGGGMGRGGMWVLC